MAVPTFLLVSAFLYGLRRNDEMPLQKNFILKRFKTLAVVYYPFIISVFLYYAITDTDNIGKYGISLAGELLFLCNFVEPLPLCGHLWFMQTLILCYLTLYATKINYKFISKLFINPQMDIF
jgi:fucose 4-O-acetylase-like acetyltransferase